MTVLIDATPDYVSINDGALDTRHRYIRRRDVAGAIVLSSGETWGAEFTGSADGVFGVVFGIDKDAPAPGTAGLSSGNVTGVGTTFTTTFAVGDYMTIGDTRFGRITAIASNTQMTLENPYSGTLSGLSYRPYLYCCAIGQWQTYPSGAIEFTDDA